MAKLQLPRDRYTVGWLCALAKTELAAATAILDEQHQRPKQPPDDNNFYTYGRIGEHNVVIACLPAFEPGKVSAHRLVAPLKHSFRKIEIYLFVGVGGGIPRHAICQNTRVDLPDGHPLEGAASGDGKVDIHVGDVVVGWSENSAYPGVVQYDLRRDHQDEAAYTIVGTLDKPDLRIRGALNGVLRDHALNRPQFEKDLETLRQRFPHPGADNDKLYQTDHKHVNANLGSSPCALCDKEKLVERTPRDPVAFVFHLGTILSGDTVMWNAIERDKLSRQFPYAVCLEMEAAGLVDDTHCLVIRGIADYADSHKNDLWKTYAASSATAFACALLRNVHPRGMGEESSQFGRSYSHSQGSQSSIPDSRNASRSISPHPRSNQLQIEQSNEGPASTSQATIRSRRMPGDSLTVGPQVRLVNATVRESSPTLSTSTIEHIDKLIEAGSRFLNRRSSKERQEELLGAQHCFETAYRVVLPLESPNFAARLFKILHKLINVETRLSYNEMATQGGKEGHIQKAEFWINRACEAVPQGSNIMIDSARTELERGIVKARDVELKAERPAASPNLEMLKTQALKMIDDALLQLRQTLQDRSKYKRFEEYAEHSRRRLLLL